MFTQVRKKLNGLEYPVNHTYDPETLEPLDIMKDRIGLLNKNAPEMMEGGNSLLDIGSNKGFISFHLNKKYKKIVGYEPLKPYVDICNEIKELHKIKNIKFIRGSFKDIPDNVTYDVVFVGNVQHYFFRDCVLGGKDGYDYLRKLDMIANKYIIFDGPQEGSDFAIIGLGKDNGWSEKFGLKKYSLARLKDTLGWEFIRVGFNGIGEGYSSRHTVVFKKPELIKFNPHSLLKMQVINDKFMRWDVIIGYLALKEYLELGEVGEFGYFMALKDHYMSKHCRGNVEDVLLGTSLHNLKHIHKKMVRKGGFLKGMPMKLFKDSILNDGMHRLVCSLILNCDVYARAYTNSVKHYTALNWYKNIFDEKTINILVETKNELVGKG